MTHTLDEPQLRWGVYTRISRYDGEGPSPGTQRQEADCRAEVERRGGSLARLYTDDDKSAFSGKRRTGYEALCDDLKNRIIDGVIVWHNDPSTVTRWSWRSSSSWSRSPARRSPR